MRTVPKIPQNAVATGQYRAAPRRTREKVRKPNPTFSVESKRSKVIQRRLGELRWSGANA